ncbi:hypothetical protein [Acinetobacter guillouiae]|uniref:hypothetical protein n=1 Tax=Acinetobacter guillouiae TaxID=106649 RepID=UPI002FD9D2B5
MKNHLQLIFNVIIIIALAGIAYLVWNQSKQNKQDHNTQTNIKPNQLEASQTDLMTATQSEIQESSIIDASSQTEEIRAIRSVSNAPIKVKHCGAEEYSADCDNPHVPRVYFMYSVDSNNPALIDSISLGKPIGYADMLINEVKITAKDGLSCEVATWSPDGETLTDMGIDVSLMPCPEKQIKHIDLKINGKYYRFV